MQLIPLLLTGRIRNQNYNGQIYTIGDSSRMLPTYLITFRQAVVYRSP